MPIEYICEEIKSWITLVTAHLPNKALTVFFFLLVVINKNICTMNYFGR